MDLMTKRNESVPIFRSVFDDFFTKDLFDWNSKHFSDLGSTLPSVNVKETERGFNLELAAPGMQKDDFNIELNHNVLTISSEQKDEKSEEDYDGRYTRREFNYQSFSRSFTLPENADHSKIEASYDDGVLYVSIPKKEIVSKLSSKTIEIK